MSNASSEQNKPSEVQERIYRAFKMNLEAFFEGHDIGLGQRDGYLKRIRKDLAVAMPKTSPSRVKIATGRDINRMWANHEKAQRMSKKQP
jgi:hypothetical protein